MRRTSFGLLDDDDRLRLRAFGDDPLNPSRFDASDPAQLGAVEDVVDRRTPDEWMGEMLRGSLLSQMREGPPVSMGEAAPNPTIFGGGIPGDASMPRVAGTDGIENLAGMGARGAGGSGMFSGMGGWQKALMLLGTALSGFGSRGGNMIPAMMMKMAMEDQQEMRKEQRAQERAQTLTRVLGQMQARQAAGDVEGALKIGATALPHIESQAQAMMLNAYMERLQKQGAGSRLRSAAGNVLRDYPVASALIDAGMDPKDAFSIDKQLQTDYDLQKRSDGLWAIPKGPALAQGNAQPIRIMGPEPSEPKVVGNQLVRERSEGGVDVLHETPRAPVSVAPGSQLVQPKPGGGVDVLHSTPAKPTTEQRVKLSAKESFAVALTGVDERVLENMLNSEDPAERQRAVAVRQQVAQHAQALGDKPDKGPQSDEIQMAIKIAGGDPTQPWEKQSPNILSKAAVVISQLRSGVAIDKEMREPIGMDAGNLLSRTTLQQPKASEPKGKVFADDDYVVVKGEAERSVLQRFPAMASAIEDLRAIVRRRTGNPITDRNALFFKRTGNVVQDQALLRAAQANWMLLGKIDADVTAMTRAFGIFAPSLNRLSGDTNNVAIVERTKNEEALGLTAGSANATLANLDVVDGFLRGMVTSKGIEYDKFVARYRKGQGAPDTSGKVQLGGPKTADEFLKKHGM